MWNPGHCAVQEDHCGLEVRFHRRVPRALAGSGEARRSLPGARGAQSRGPRTGDRRVELRDRGYGGA